MDELREQLTNHGVGLADPRVPGRQVECGGSRRHHQ
jgi:hypothetical protein